MLNNDRPSQNKHQSDSQSRPQGKHHDYRVKDARHEHDSYGSSSTRKQQNKTTRIALSILTILAVLLIGFEISDKEKAKEGRNTERDAGLEAKGNKSLQILAMQREQELPRLITTLNPGVREAAFDEAQALKEANRVQSHKIKMLQRQLAESTQKLHDIKAHLFTKSDPNERTRLASICQDLVEKEQQNEELQTKLDQLEIQREQSAQKIRRMEQTVDALASMTDTQRETKEQAILSYQEVLEKLETENRKIQQEYEKARESFTVSELDLKTTLAEKIHLIDELEKEIARHEEILEQKEQEGVAQASLYRASESSLQEQLQNLIAGMELELLRNNKLLADMEVLEAKSNAHEEYNRTLQKKIEEHKEAAAAAQELQTNAQIALAEEHLDAHGLLSIYAESHDKTCATQSKLKKMVKEEKERADSLDKELRSLKEELSAEQQRGLCMEQEMQAAVNRAAKLDEQLKTQTSLLESKYQELDMLSHFQASLKEQFQQKIQSLQEKLSEEEEKAKERDRALADVAFHLELEKTQTMQLNHRAREADQTIEDHVAKVRDLETGLNEKTETLSSVQDALNNSRQEVQELRSQLDAAYSTLEGERFRTQELHQALVRSLEENENDLTAIDDLKHQLQGQTETLALLQDRLNDKKEAINQLQEQIDELTKTLEAEQQEHADARQQVAYIAQEKQAIEEHASHLEMRFNDTSDEAVNLQDTLKQREEELRALYTKMNALMQELDAQRQQAKALEEKVDQLSQSQKSVPSDPQIKNLQEELQKLRKENDQLLQQTKNQAQLILHQQAIGQEKGEEVSLRESTPIRPESRQESAVVHTVVPGDSLSTISVYYYGTPSRWIDIFEANRTLLKTKETPLKKGMQLQIP